MKTPLFLSQLLAAFSVISAEFPTSILPIVEVEEEVYEYENADNGAGPMWCSSSTSIVRVGEQLFASGLETVKGIAPLNNCRWFLLRRTEEGWKKVIIDEKGLTREPSPLVCYPNDSVFLSANPTFAPRGKGGGGPARPEVLRFPLSNLGEKKDTLLPLWQGNPSFSEHSYRSFAADGQNQELILFQNIGYDHAEWSFLDRSGKWSSQGKLVWPWGADYAKPQPIRICYPNVAIRNRIVHFCGVSDIIEPNLLWREAKKKITGREWDYEFRRLFYTWSQDISKGNFNNWIELASREQTCGWITPGDLWVAPDGTAHIIWTERALDERLQPDFFPNSKQVFQLNYATVRQGKVMERRLLIESGIKGEIPGRARFHATPDQRLFALIYVSGMNLQGKAISENRIMELGVGGMKNQWTKIPIKQPFTDFFTASERAGCIPSWQIDMLGTQSGKPMKIGYARIRL